MAKRKVKKKVEKIKLDKKTRKKIEIIIIVLMIISTIVLLYYFNNKKLVYKCNKILDLSASGYKIKTNYDIYAYKDDTKYIEIKETVYSDENSILDYYKKDLTKMYEEQNKKYGGYTIKTEKDMEKVTVTVRIDISKTKLKDFAKDNNISDFIKDDKLTPEGAKKAYTNIGATCE